jgi:hypothetical protein
MSFPCFEGVAEGYMTGFVGTVTGVTEAGSGLAPIDPGDYGSVTPHVRRSRDQQKQTSRFGINA